MENLELLAEPDLVGRENELETLQHYLDLAVQGKGTTVFVSGEAGSGKTRLVNEFLSASKQKRDINQLSGWCLSNSVIPYFPFMEAFNVYSSGYSKKGSSSGMRQGGLQQGLEKEGLVVDEELGLRAWLMGPGKTERKRELEELSPQAWKDSTFAAVTKALFSMSAKKPTILFIDDLQWADTASLTLLQYISRFIASEKVLILSTFRSEDLNPDSEGHPHPLADTLRLMSRENLYKEIKLQSLNRFSVSLLAEDMVGGHIQADLAEKLAVESQGNPLFIVESLKMLLEEGGLIQENDRWRLSTGKIGIPTKIKDILVRRLGVLKPAQRKMLEIASVIGYKFNPELLASVAAQDSLETLETLNSIEQSTSLVIGEGDMYRFDHGKYREALYEEISQPLRRAYHGRIAERIKSSRSAAGKLPVGDLAFHYAEAGNKEKAVKYSLDAGQEALKIYSGTEAIKHFRYVLDATTDIEKYAHEMMIALEGLGDGLYAKGRCGEATEVFERLSKNTTSNSVKARALGKAIDASFFWGEYSRTLDYADRIVEYPELTPLERARVRFNRAKARAWGGEFVETSSAHYLKEMEESLRVFEGEYSLSDIHSTLLEMTTAYVSNDQLENAIAAAIRARALSEFSKNAGETAMVASWMSLTYSITKLEDEGLKALEDAIRVNEKISDPVSRAFVETTTYWMSGQLIEAKAASKLFSGLPLETMRSFGAGAKFKFFMSSLISGALRDFKQSLKAAIAQSLKGAACADETDSYFYKTFNYGNLVREYSLLGDIEHAEEYYKKLKKIFDDTSISGIFHSRAAYASVRATYFSSRKKWKEANQFHEEAIAIYDSGQIAGDRTMPIAGERQAYCWDLLQQGRFSDAKIQFEKAKRAMEDLDRRFEHSNVIGHIIGPARVKLGIEFNMRLDLINVAKNPAVLIQIEELVPSEFSIVSMQPSYNVQKNAAELEKKSLKPFTDDAITFTLKATKTGDFNLNPQLIYVNELGETKICKVDPISITVLPPDAVGSSQKGDA
jgi:tetratricopeptide (TPR) repeat protein